MLLAGNNIISISDELKKVTVEYLFFSIRNPKPNIESRIRQLRIIYSLDAKQYSLLKRQLPYVVCGIFNPPYRKKENFAYIEDFIVDIDHLSEKGLSLSEVRSHIQKDPQVVLCFMSPSEDGLKVLFHLKERCYDPNKFSLFYKAFSHQFSINYHLEQAIDSKTSDVTRACFISMDSNVYYNTEALSVDMSEYISDIDIVATFDLKSKLEKEEANSTVKVEESAQHEPDKEILDRIKLKLNPNSKPNPKEKASVYVPKELEMITDDLKKYVEETGIMLDSIINIQYGKKLHFKTGFRQAEINLFFGKRGFSVVQSPRCGTSAELNKLMAELIKQFVSNLYND
jgi:hypothetical protein